VFRGRGRFAAAVVLTSLVGAIAPLTASAHPFSEWAGKSGPFRWQAETVSCGAVPGELNRIHAHTRWVTSPPNGYQRARFLRQIWDETASAWTTVARATHSTKNTLEGLQAVLHWTQRFQPVASEEGQTSRNVVLFAWKRDRNGPDPTVFARRVQLEPCIVGP
jgi:hypothetical protein